ncbi:hypothetical protein PVAND_016228 [Polypedilum vanderplanki]|uniref:GDNF/GAS1 domain-containing protein n=1 Tax=Polypedilum vanderplanki TaxID=319348 RepID=A0A9J6BEG9_POLVA|nr:hypothetical protein PVAND_016228 [Polypedilum vanderplanki]
MSIKKSSTLDDGEIHTGKAGSGNNVKIALAILNCILTRQLCFEDPSCSAILEIIPRVCGPVPVACSTVTVTKCQAALRTLQAFPFFRPTCLCKEPGVDPDCNYFRDFLFDHPCGFVLKKVLIFTFYKSVIMKFSICFTILILFQLFVTIKSFIIACEFEKVKYSTVGSVYQCTTHYVKTSSDETITGVIGSHLSGYTNSDVESIVIYGDHKLPFFPRGIKNFFPYIKALFIDGTTMDALYGDELDEFSDLKIFWFEWSYLTTISSKLFEKTPKIADIEFNFNKIERVGKDLFTNVNITQLESLYFLYNRCINQKGRNLHEIFSLINELKENCPFDDDFSVTTNIATTTFADKTTTSSATALKITVVFFLLILTMSTYLEFINLYECQTEQIPISSGNIVTKVIGTHLNDKSNEDVQAIWINGKSVLNFFPRGLTNIFPNIKAMTFVGTAIETLYGDELDEFPNLQYINFRYSNLTRISSRLFQKTPKINYIYFDYNTIQNVGYDLFSSLDLKSFLRIAFVENRCINQLGYSESAIIELIKELRTKCSYDDEELYTTTTTVKPTKRCFY